MEGPANDVELRTAGAAEDEEEVVAVVSSATAWCQAEFRGRGISEPLFLSPSPTKENQESKRFRLFRCSISESPVTRRNQRSSSVPCDVFCSFWRDEAGEASEESNARVRQLLALQLEARIFASPFALRSPMRLDCVYYRPRSCASALTSLKSYLRKQEAKRKKGEPRGQGIVGGSRKKRDSDFDVAFFCVSAAPSTSPRSLFFFLPFSFNSREKSRFILQGETKSKKLPPPYSQRSTR